MGNKYQKGFEQSQKRIDDLRNLVVTSKIQSYYLGESVENAEFFIERTRLPQDYLFLINILTSIRFNCAGSAEPTLSSFFNNYIKVSLTPPINGYVLTAIQFYDPNNPSAIGGNIISNSAGIDYNYYSNPANYNFSFIPEVSVQDSTASWPYEFLAELTPVVDSNTLLISHTNQLLVSNGWRAIWTNPLTQEQEIVEYANATTVVKAKRDNEDLPIKKVPCKYVQQDDIHAILYDPFNTTKHKYPKYTIQENFIDIYSDNKFIPIFVELTYIRHPKKLDSITGVGCELPEHTHQEIVEMAVQSILEATENPRYQTQSREVLESE